ncbi:MAG: ABC transporter permease [Dehalococcoidia bacterium]|jgi:simple sugar transport system permease protein
METYEATILTIVTMSSPLIFAVIGETISERVGIVNLSMEGTLLITALAGFAATIVTNSPYIGIICAGLLGGGIALFIVLINFQLQINQIAIGFILTILLWKLSSYLGQSYVRIPGPYLDIITVPYLSDIPFIGPIIFNSNILTISSIFLIPLSWYFLFKTQLGINLRSVGENPASADARGINVMKTRLIYAVLGGILIGIGGAAFSLHVKYGWSEGHTINYGWIALAIVIFGGWNPIRGSIGVYGFGALQVLALKLQSVTIGFSQILPLIPFPLMILTLVLIQSANKNSGLGIPKIIRILILGNQPQALGITYKKNG